MKQKFEALYFSTTWCGPCSMFKPAFQQFADEHPEIAVKYVDLEKDEESAKTYKHLNITTVPTVVFLKNGNEEARLSGLKSKKALEQIFEDITF